MLLTVGHWTKIDFDNYCEKYGPDILDSIEDDILSLDLPTIAHKNIVNVKTLNIKNIKNLKYFNILYYIITYKTKRK